MLFVCLSIHIPFLSFASFFENETIETLTGDIVKTRFVQDSGKELEADDGINDHDKENEQGNVQQGHHGHQDRVENHLKT